MEVDDVTHSSHSSRAYASFSDTDGRGSHSLTSMLNLRTFERHRSR